MKRKRFLRAMLGTPLLAATEWPAKGPGAGPAEKEWRIPPYLKAGDTIGITCPAGYMTLDELQPAIRILQGWGFHLRIGKTVGQRDFGFGGRDEVRLADFQEMLDDPAVQAILCGRGGYGSVRIIDALDFRRFAQHPKWIAGFSDVTVIHAQLNHQYRIASLHSKMCNSFPEDPAQLEKGQWDSILSIRRALTGESIEYPVVYDLSNRKGSGRGILAGGNLKTIESLAGSASDLKTEGAILFLEDANEYLYSVDRMFYNLKRSGKLAGLRGLLIGGFRVKPDDPGDEFGRSIYNIVMDQVATYDYPVCFNFPVGHQKINYALKCGVEYQLEVGEYQVSFREAKA
jgi:muramoyltetrapeptide carboxypeptidase